MALTKFKYLCSPGINSRVSVKYSQQISQSCHFSDRSPEENLNSYFPWLKLSMQEPHHFKNTKQTLVDRIQTKGTFQFLQTTKHIHQHSHERNQSTCGTYHHRNTPSRCKTNHKNHQTQIRGQKGGRHSHSSNSSR